MSILSKSELAFFSLNRQPFFSASAFSTARNSAFERSFADRPTRPMAERHAIVVMIFFMLIGQGGISLKVLSLVWKHRDFFIGCNLLEGLPRWKFHFSVAILLQDSWLRDDHRAVLACMCIIVTVNTIATNVGLRIYLLDAYIMQILRIEEIYAKADH